MSHRVLVGFAGGEPSLDALALGGAIAAATGGHILALHVQEAEAPYSPFDAEDQVIRRSDAADMRARLERAAPELAPGVRVGFDAFPAKNAAAGLHEFASTEQVGLVVTGPTHLNPVAAVLLGATGERLLDACPCPVAVASHGLRERAPVRLKRMGCGLDESAESILGLHAAADLARAAGADLEALTVVPRGLGLPQRRRSQVEQANARLQKALSGVGMPDARPPCSAAGPPRSSRRRPPSWICSCSARAATRRSSMRSPAACRAGSSVRPRCRCWWCPGERPGCRHPRDRSPLPHPARDRRRGG